MFLLFLDYKELLKVEGIDWIMIGSKNYQHYNHCIDSFKANKNVFCEKPLAISIEECENIRKVYKETKKLFATGFVLRHAPMYEKIKEIVSNGELGELISIEANELLAPGHGGYIMRNWRRYREQSGPHILEKCCHDIDILTWLVGTVPSKVAAFGGTNIFLPKNAPEKAEDLDHYQWWPQAYEDVNPFTVDKTIEDNILVILEYRNNVRVTFHTNCNSAWAQRRMEICGIKGTLEADFVTDNIKWKKIGNSQQLHKEALIESGLHGGGDYRIIENLCESMAKGTIPKTTGEEGFVSAVICLAIDEARIKGQVVDLEPYWKRFEI